jgi:gliding motility-associated-like protein
MITVNPSPTARLTASPTTITFLNPDVSFLDQSYGGSNCWLYFGDGDSVNNCSTLHQYDVAGTYIVSQVVENQYGCKDYYKIKIVSDIFSFWIPNAFTPNLDGKNEAFGPVVMGVKKFHFSVFDRWGNKIFETHDPLRGWDGTLNGNSCQEDTYVWKISFEKTGENSTERNYVGNVSLVR